LTFDVRKFEYIYIVKYFKLTDLNRLNSDNPSHTKTIFKNYCTVSTFLMIVFSNY